MPKYSPEDIEPNTFRNDYVELGEIFSFLYRNKKFIGTISFISSLIALLYSFSLNKNWEGQFQIAIKNQSTIINPLSLINPALSGFTNLEVYNKAFKTEVAILESPLVLMPVFNLIKSDELKINRSSDLNFEDWKNNIKVQIKKDTSILDISYRDKDKENIIPVLNKINSAYQEYSSKNKRKELNLYKDFLKKQIILFKDKSFESLKEAKEFAIDNNLIFNTLESTFPIPINNLGGDIFFNFSPFSSSNLSTGRPNFSTNTQIEGIRIAASNEIKKIDLQLKQIKNFGNNIEKLQYIGSSIPEIYENELSKSIAKIDKLLLEKSLNYSEADFEIKRLVEQKTLLVNGLKKRVVGFLNDRRLEAEARMTAATRSKEVLLKFEALIKKFYKDQSTLNNLENQLFLSHLEASRQEDPWILITEPRLFPNAILADKKKLVLVGFIFGFLIASGIMFYKEFKKGVIYDKKKLEIKSGSSIIQEIERNAFDADSEQFLFIRDFLKLKSVSDLCLLNLDEGYNSYGDSFVKNINKNSPKINVVEIKSLKDFNYNLSNSFILLITKLGSLKLSKINLLKRRLEKFDKNISGIILVD